MRQRKEFKDHNKGEQKKVSLDLFFKGLKTSYLAIYKQGIQ